MSTPIVALDARLVCGTSTGDSTYWTGLLHGLSKQRSGIRFLLFSNAPRPSGIPRSEEFEWIHLPGRGRWWSLVRFPMAARRRGAHVIHTQYNLSPLARNGVTTIHDVSFFIGPEWFRPRDRALLRRFVPASVRRAKRVLAVSETTKRELQQYIPESTGKTTVTYNACPPWIEPVSPEAARERVERLRIAPPYMLTVGTRWPRKNMRLATEATEMLPATTPHRLAITGKPGWGEEAQGRRSTALGYVSNEDLSALYSLADLYLAPSRHEGFGVPLVEAFVCGCPVLCSSGGALPEVAGDAAVVERSWEPADWARSIELLLSDSSKLDSLRQRGKERAADFTWEDTARKTADVYKEILS